MKQILVDLCRNCPYLIFDKNHFRCDHEEALMKQGTVIQGIDKLPKWCPLEDYNSDQPDDLNCMADIRK